jgi:S-adenosylmethionine hydrolase
MELIIALLTDFGTKGQHYVAQMKGVILKINPNVKIIDLSHEVTPYSIIEASYLLKTSYKHFPENTVFIIVVDPGVGTSREILILKTLSNYIFIGPNNGVFSGILSEGVSEVINIQNEDYFNKPVSSTFHGREIMAPVAASISKGVDLNNYGPNLEPEKIIKLDLDYNLNPNKGGIDATIQYIDNFGNLITNIPIDTEDPFLKENDELTVLGKDYSYKGIFVSNFESVPIKALLFLNGSSGFLEISINQGDASMTLGLKVGDIINIKSG